MLTATGYRAVSIQHRAQRRDCEAIAMLRVEWRSAGRPARSDRIDVTEFTPVTAAQPVLTNNGEWRNHNAAESN